MLRLAVDAHNLLCDVRGIARYVRAVLARFAADDAVDVTLLTKTFPAMLTRRRFEKLLGSSRFALVNRVPRRSHVVWHPWNGTFFASRLPTVATIHDCFAFSYPVAADKYEQTVAPIRRSFASTLILTDSQYSARAIAHYGAVPAERIRVVPLAVEHDVFSHGAVDAARNGVEHMPYILAVGMHDARKNFDTLYAAWKSAFPLHDVRLVVVGPPPGVAEDVEVRTNIGDVELQMLYAQATAVAVPSVDEGFGLPVLEAMAAGAPVVASHAASLPEVGGDAVRWVHAPRDPAAWAQALRAVAGDAAVRDRLRERGLARARTFTWDATARLTRDVLAEAAAR